MVVAKSKELGAKAEVFLYWVGSRRRQLRNHPVDPWKLEGSSSASHRRWNKLMWFAKLWTIWPQALASLQAKLIHTFWSGCRVIFWSSKVPFPFLTSHLCSCHLMVPGMYFLPPFSVWRTPAYSSRHSTNVILSVELPWHFHYLLFSRFLQNSDLSSTVACLTL